MSRGRGAVGTAPRLASPAQVVEEAHALVTDLAHRRFAKRELASRRLLQLGPTPLAPLPTPAPAQNSPSGCEPQAQTNAPIDLVIACGTDPHKQGDPEAARHRENHRTCFHEIPTPCFTSHFKADFIAVWTTLSVDIFLVNLGRLGAKVGQAKLRRTRAVLAR